MVPCPPVNTASSRTSSHTTLRYRLLMCLIMCFVDYQDIGAATTITEDPQGFFGSSWGQSLDSRSDLKQIDSSETLGIYTLITGQPQIDGIALESVKLYTLEDKYARALFRYHGEATHKQLIAWLEAHFGAIERSYGSMMRGLNQQYTWRGPETEIAITYHGFRQRGLLIAESRVFSPMFLDALSDSGH